MFWIRARRVTVQYDIVSCVAMFLASLSLPPLDTQEVSNSFLLLSLSLLFVVSQHWSDRRMIVEHEIYFFPNQRYFLFLSRSIYIYTAMMEMELLKIQRIFMRRDKNLSLIRLICLKLFKRCYICCYIHIYILNE